MRLLLFLLLCALSSQLSGIELSTGTDSSVYQNTVDSLNQVAQPDSSTFSSYLDVIRNLYKKNPVSAEELSIEVLKKAIDAGEKEISFSCRNYLALIYLELSDYDKAQQEIIDNEQLIADMEPGYLHARQYGTYGLFYYAQGIYEEALLSMKKANKYWQKTDNRKELAKSLNNIGAFYLEMHENDSALQYFNQALEYKMILNDQASLAFTLGNIGSLYRQMDQPAKALEYLVQARTLNEESNQMANLSLINRLIANVNISLGNTDEARKDLARAEYYAITTESPKMHFLIYNEFANYHESKGYYDSAFLYKTKFSNLKDSVYNYDKSFAIHQIRMDHEKEMKDAALQISRQKLQLLQAENERNDLIRYFLTGLAIATILIAVYITHNVKAKARKRKELYEQRKKIEELQMEKLLSEIEHKNRKLTSTALEIIRKNDSLTQIKEELHLLNEQLSEADRKHIKPIHAIVNYSFDTDRNWEDFKLAFEEVHTDFFDKIRKISPSLSPAEIKLCALLRLNFSSKEIGNLLGISADSVKTSRSRLRKKLQLSRENNLVEFMIAL